MEGFSAVGLVDLDLESAAFSGVDLWGADLNCFWGAGFVFLV